MRCANAGSVGVKYLTEYRDAAIARPLIERIKRTATRPWTLMEVCGGQTHTIVRQGLDELLEGTIEMIHGPGCPVCVTPLEQIDKALLLAARSDVIFTSFGDMLRVPGSDCDLQQVRARGGNVRVVYSPLDALEIARHNPDLEVVFFAVGFETTAPANAMAVWRARELGVSNFSVLVSHVTVPPAISAIMDSPDNRVQGFLAAGHVCAVMGWTEYEPLATRYRVPIVVTGFEPLDILEGMLMAVQQLEAGTYRVENQYVRSVRREGTPAARIRVEEVFELVDRKWRGIGEIPMSGLRLRSEFVAYDAEVKFGLGHIHVNEPAECHAGEVLTGKLKPPRCPAFGTRCNPEHPLGALMVSAEGACAAYYHLAKYRDVSNSRATGAVA
jgi:hydrogenase expression/formation protein HypD